MSPANSSRSTRRATSTAELSRIGIGLLYEKGFDETTVTDIAHAAGIGRRTFFRYFPSKNDLPWGDFDTLVAEFRSRLFAIPADVPMTVALRDEIIEFNRYPDSELEHHRQRIQLLLNVPTLVAHSTLRFASWRGVIAEFVATRLGIDPLGLRPQVIAWAYLATSIASYEEWLRNPNRPLVDVLDTALETLQQQFSPNGGWDSGARS